MVSFKDQCIELRRKGLSLTQIALATKRSKTSVYFHIQNIPLSRKRKREIRQAAIKRFLMYSRKIKGISRLGRHPIPFCAWSTEFVSLIAHFMFDGEIKSGGCVYTNRSASLHKCVQTCMLKLYPFPPKYYESSPGVYRSAYYNVELSRYAREKAKELTRSILKEDRELKRTFLRSFFDDEGSVYFIGNRRAVRGYQHNSKILFLVQKLLKDFDIRSRVDNKFNEITITRFENLENFAKEINFSKGVRINGERSNSIWKQSLEKGELLRRALASYL